MKNINSITIYLNQGEVEDVVVNLAFSKQEVLAAEVVLALDRAKDKIQNINNQR